MATVVAFRAAIVPDLDADGAVYGVVVLVTDISVHNDLEARITENEAMFNDAFKHAPTGMAVADATGSMNRVSIAFATMLGRSVKQLTDQDFRAITHPDDLALSEQPFRDIGVGITGEYRLEKRYLHRSGASIHVALAVSAVCGTDGAMIRLIAQIEDVTERRRIDRDRQEINARLMLAMEAVRGGIWHIDVETQSFETFPSCSRFVQGSDASGPIDLDTYGGYIATAAKMPRQSRRCSKARSKRLRSNTSCLRSMGHGGCGVTASCCARRMVARCGSSQ